MTATDAPETPQARTVAITGGAGFLASALVRELRKATRELGYQPVYSEAESLDRTVAFFREHGPVPSPEIPETR